LPFPAASVVAAAYVRSLGGLSPSSGWQDYGAGWQDYRAGWQRLL